jgi:hypothetical protein
MMDSRNASTTDQREQQHNGRKHQRQHEHATPAQHRANKRTHTTAEHSPPTNANKYDFNRKNNTPTHTNAAEYDHIGMNASAGSGAGGSQHDRAHICAR